MFSRAVLPTSSGLAIWSPKPPCITYPLGDGVEGEGVETDPGKGAGEGDRSHEEAWGEAVRVVESGDATAGPELQS